MAWWLLCQLWAYAYGVLLSTVELSFSSKITNEFIGKFEWFRPCSIPCICWIALMCLINLQEETWKSGAAYRSSTILFKTIYSTECAIEMIQVTTSNTLLTFVRIQHNYCIILLDLLDHYDPSMDWCQLRGGNVKGTCRLLSTILLNIIVSYWMFCGNDTGNNNQH
jgi:hypothetical protein